MYQADSAIVFGRGHRSESLAQRGRSSPWCSANVRPKRRHPTRAKEKSFFARLMHAGRPGASPFTVRIKRGTKARYVEGSIVPGERQQVAAFHI